MIRGNIQNRCPYCFSKLGLLEILSRKCKKKVICKKCKHIIDDKFVIY